MIFTKPHPFRLAVKKLAGRIPIAKDLSAKEWADMPVALRESAFFSAHNASARMLQDFKNFFTDFLEKSMEEITLEDGTKTTAIKAGGRAQFVSDMKAKFGGGPDEGGGKVTDKLSTTRLELIFTTQANQAYGYGQWKEGNDATILDAFPAARFVRIGFVQEPRPLHETNTGQVRRKDDLLFWQEMNAPEIGGFGVPWAPFGYNSQMDLEDVSRAEAESMGLVEPGEQVQSPDVGFNDQLSASTRGLDPAIVDQLRAKLGDAVTFDGDRLKWKGQTDELGA